MNAIKKLVAHLNCFKKSIPVIQTEKLFAQEISADDDASDMIGFISRHDEQLKHLINCSISAWCIKCSDLPVLTFNLPQ